MRIRLRPALQAFKSIYGHRYTLLGLLIVLYSLAVYASMPSKFTLKPGNFLSLALVSISAWALWGFLMKCLPPKVRLFFDLLTAIAVAFFLLAGVYLFNEFRQFLSAGLIAFLRQQPVYLKTYAQQILHNPLQMGAWLLLAALLFALIHYRGARSIPPRKQWISFSILAVLTFVGLESGRHEYQRSFLPADLQILYSFRYGLIPTSDAKPLEHLVHLRKQDLPHDERSPEEKYNVVLIVFESLSRAPLPFYGYANRYMPFTVDWIKREKDLFVCMQNAMSVSAATDVVMPAIYTGVGPEQPYEKLTEAPFLWDYAKLNGYTTVVASSQSQKMKNFEGFIRDDNLDYYLHPGNLHLPLVNDVGADDLTVLDSVEKIFKRIRSPFFFYYNTNATHSPYQDRSPHIRDFRGIKDRYGRALFITDRIIQKIYRLIEERGELDKTFFIFIADHGDYTVKRRQRLANFYREALDIPLMVRVPPRWKKSHPQLWQRLRDNRRVRTVSLDVAPTVFHIIFDTLPGPFARRYFDGQSLMDSISPRRTVIALSTNDTRHYDAEGFGIYRGNESFLFHDNQGFEFYDLSTDSLQRHNIIDQMPRDKRQWYDSIYLHNPYMRRIVERHLHH